MKAIKEGRIWQKISGRKNKVEECVPRVASPKARVTRKRKKAIDDDADVEEEVESDSQEEEEELEVVEPATGKCKGICYFSSCAALE